MNKFRNPLLGFIAIFLLIYASTPFVIHLSLLGLVDAVTSVLAVLAVCYVLYFILGRWAFAPVAILILTIIGGTIASGQYFDLQRHYPTIDSVFLIKELLTLISTYDVWKQLTLAGAAFTALVVLSFLGWLARPMKRLNTALLAVLFMSVAIVGQWRYAEENKPYRFATNNSVPVGHFVRSFEKFPFGDIDVESAARYERMAMARQLLADPTLQMPQKYTAEGLSELLGFGPNYQDRIDEPRYPLYKRASISSSVPTVKNPLNVLVLVLESTRSSEMGSHGAKESATPFLDELSSKTTFVKQNYSTANITIQSQHAIHCSALDAMSGEPISENIEYFNTKCLPQMLAEHGYETHWFHGNDKSFYSRDAYYPLLGFDHLHDREYLNRHGAMPEFGWGITDLSLAKHVPKVLASLDEPFYAEFLTVSNHLPFDFDWGITFPAHLQDDSTYHARYRRGIYYADQAVKVLFEEMEKHGLLENTIVVVTGDHGIWTFENEFELTELQKNEQLHRVPLMILAPGREPSKISGAHSHLDIAPSLLDLLEFDVANDFMGQSVYSDNPYKQNRVVYSMNAVSVSYRRHERTCVPTVQCHNSVQCTSVFEENIPQAQCFTIPEDTEVLHSELDFKRSPEPASWQERDLFDYSQMTHMLGSFPTASDVLIAEDQSD